MKQGMKRYLYSQIEHDLAEKMVFMGGPRQVGKTFLSKQFLKDQSRYLNWDKLEDRDQILKEKLNPKGGLYVLDELHKYKNWRRLIKGYFQTASGVTGTNMDSYGAYEFWMKTTSSTASYIVGMYDASNTGCNRKISQVYLNTSGKAVFGVRKQAGGTQYVVTSTTSVNDGNWHHITAVWDATNGYYLYVDGSLEASDTTSPGSLNARTRNVNVGGGDLGSGCGWTGITGNTAFAGTLDEVTIYSNTALPTATEIARRAKSRLCRTTTTFSANTFYNVAATYDNSTRIGRIYVDGVEECNVTFASGTTATPSQNLTLGADITASSTFRNYWSGGISDFKLFTTYSSSTPDDVYQSTRARHGK